MRQMESASPESVHTAFCAVKVDAGNHFRHYLFPLIPNKERSSLLASTFKRNSLPGAEVLQVGVNLATDRMRGGSDSTPLLDGQNAAAACMAGGIMFSGQRDFKPVRVRLDR